MVARWRLPPLIGAWFWTRKVQRPLRRKHSKYFAALIGDLSTGLLGGKPLHEKRRRTWSRTFLLACSNTEIWMQSGARRDVCVLICLCRSNVFWRASGNAPAELSDTRLARTFHWTNCSSRRPPILSWQKTSALTSFTSAAGP